MNWITLEENDNYEINENGEIRYKVKGNLIKNINGYFSVYRNDKKKQLNLAKLMVKYFNKTVDLPGEIWYDIKNYEGLYAISNFNRIKSLPKKTNNSSAEYVSVEKIMKPTKTKFGYLVVNLRKDNVGKSISVHRIVATAFIDNPDNLLAVNHINGVKTDNRVENLEWCTLSENTKHAFRTGLSKGRRKVNI